MSLGSLILGEGILGGDNEVSGGGGGELPKLVAILNGPSGYIYQVDANGLTEVEIRFNGLISLPSFNPAGGPGDVLRYYKDPADTTGALLNESVDPAWDMDLHRGNGFVDLGLFHINDPPIADEAINGTLAVTQAAQSLAGAADLIGVGSLSTSQDDNLSLSFGLVDPKPTGGLVALQADNFLFSSAFAPGRGSLSVQQDPNFLVSGATSPTFPGLLEIVEIDVDGYLEAAVSVDSFLFAEMNISPVIEGAVM